jgi:hypothetical protein
MNLIRTAVALATATVLAASAIAQTPPPPPGARGVETTVNGRVARWLLNPNGEVDGLLLADGTQVAFPPHLSAALTEAVKAKDAVEITGRRGESGTLVRASMIRNTTSGRSVADEPGAGPGPRRPAPPAAGALTAMNASGRIGTLLHTGRGDINGVLLQDGTIVRFPPHVGADLADTLKPGAAFYARGYGTRTAQGNALEATALGTDAETAREVFAGPRPAARPGPDGAPPRPGAPGRPMPPGGPAGPASAS